MEGQAQTIVIHHALDRGSSRNVLGLIREAGNGPVGIPSLETGLTMPQWHVLVPGGGSRPTLEAAGLESADGGTGIADETVTDAMRLSAGMAHRVLVTRSIAACRKGVRLCRNNLPLAAGRPRLGSWIMKTSKQMLLASR